MEHEQLPKNGAARLLALAVGADPQWRADDLGPMLAHQWQAELATDLGGLPGVDVPMVRERCEAAAPGIRTFADLLWHPSPPVQLLIWVKEFAKRAAGHPTRPLPRDLAAAIYAIVVVVAQGHGHAISTQDGAAIARSAAWTLSQPWLDGPTRELILQSLAKIEENRQHPP